MKPYTNTPFDLTGKTALISGAAGLLGLEFSQALASAGVKLLLADIHRHNLEKAQNVLVQKFPQTPTLAQQLDVTDLASIEHCVQKMQKEWGQIDILVNSAAIDPKFDKGSDTGSYSRFTEFPLAMWTQSLDVNLTGTFLLTQQVCQVMEKIGKGSIITIGSNYGLVAPDQRIYKKADKAEQSFKPAVYSVCKAGLIGLTKYLAAYYAGSEIRVNMLTPSGVFNEQEEEFVQNYASRTILRRMSKKTEYQGAILFLASDASSYMTGANLVIDGGWTAL